MPLSCEQAFFYILVFLQVGNIAVSINGMEKSVFCQSGRPRTWYLALPPLPTRLFWSMVCQVVCKNEPVHDLCRQFNAETDDGRNMAELSELLSEAIRSIIDAKEESDIDSLFSAGGTSALMSAVSGLDDFDLICFLAVK